MEAGDIPAESVTSEATKRLFVKEGPPQTPESPWAIWLNQTGERFKH